MAAALGAGKPGVNRGFKEQREAGLAWGLKAGCYQLHPLLTDDRVAATAMAVPEIKAAAPEQFSKQRRARYASGQAEPGLWSQGPG